MIRDCSDEYKAWDNVELGDANLRSVWDHETKQFIAMRFSGVVVRRTDDTKEFPNFQDLQIAGNVQVMLVAAATVGGAPLADGDTIHLSDCAWTVTGDVHVARAGVSVSHYKVICNAHRG